MNKYKLLIQVYFIFFTIIFSTQIDDVKTQYKNGDFITAHQSITTYIKNNPDDPLGYILASEISLSLDSLGKANEYLVKAIDLDKINEEFRKKWTDLDSLRQFLKEAKRKYDSGLIDEGIIAYEKIIKLNPEFAMPYHRLGRIFYSENDFDNAVYYFRKAIDINPFNSSYRNDITNIAKKLAQEGDKIFRRKDYENAAKKYLQSTKIDPNYTEAFYRSGKAYYFFGDYKSAKDNLFKAVENDNIHVQSLKLLGDILIKEGNDLEALEWYKKAVDANSNYHIAHYALGKTYYRLEDKESALISLKNAVMIYPTYSKAYELIGVIEQLNGNFNESIANYELAVFNDKNAYTAYYRLSSVLNEIKKYNEAKKSAKVCIDIKRNYAAAWYELGIAEKKLGNKAAAKIAFKEAMKDRKWKKSAQYEIKMIDKDS